MTKSMIFPKPLAQGDTIAVTAPSSGVPTVLHPLLHRSRKHMEQLGFNVVEGQTIWTEDKCVSAPREVRAREFMQYLLDPNIQAIIPPWGGEFLMDILPLLDWEQLKEAPPKWVLGYSDISTFLFAYTLRTGVATAHGPNYVDVSSSNPLDPVTARWLDVLGNTHAVEQVSSTHYQSAWNHDIPGFHLDTLSTWKSLGENETASANKISFTGRVIGGCMDTISILIGTPYAPVQSFVQEYCLASGVVWYLESCEMNAADIYRHLWQMKQCGWFEHATGILIGRPAGYSATQNFEMTDALSAALGDLGIPVLYDVDIGHMPPQLTLINGALATVTYQDGQGQVVMTFE